MTAAAHVAGAARYVGSRVHRVEDARLLTGAGTFVDDIVRPGMLHACFVRSPHPRALITATDASAALALPGVHAVFTAADLNHEVREAWYTGTTKHVPDTPRPPLADGEARFAGDPVALVVADSRYLAEQACAAVPMETRGLVVEWSAASGELTIWAATQAPHEVRMFCARLLGLPEHRIRVIARDVGGGFGQKVVPLREDICLMLAARKVPGALKWIEDRRENLMSAGQARHEHGTARLAFDQAGTIIAASLDHVQDVGAYPTPWPVGTGAATGMLFPGPYRIARARSPMRRCSPTPRAASPTAAGYRRRVGAAVVAAAWQRAVARAAAGSAAAGGAGREPDREAARG